MNVTTAAETVTVTKTTTLNGNVAAPAVMLHVWVGAGACGNERPHADRQWGEGWGQLQIPGSKLQISNARRRIRDLKFRIPDSRSEIQDCFSRWPLYLSGLVTANARGHDEMKASCEGGL
jgi:hypothetical protein